MARSLSAAYYDHLRPESELIRAKLRWPDFAWDARRLKAWCPAEPETARRAAKRSVLLGPGGAQGRRLWKGPSRCCGCQAWSAAVEAEIEVLSESSIAHPLANFLEKEYIPYSREEAEKLRLNTKR